MPTPETNEPKKPPVVPASELTNPRGTVLHTENPHISYWLLIALGVVLLVILVAIIVWVRTNTTTPVIEPTITRPTVEENDEPESTTAEAVTETLQAMSPSTELSSIEADLDATVILDLDSSFADIDALVQ